jgi:hypothetical protein
VKKDGLDSEVGYSSSPEAPSFIWTSVGCAALFVIGCIHREQLDIMVNKGIGADQQHFHYVCTPSSGLECFHGGTSGLSGEAVGDLPGHDLSSNSSGAFGSSACSRHDKCSSSICVATVGQVRSKDNRLTSTDQVTVVADDLGVGGADLADRFTVVWVAKDNCTLDECRLVCGQHRSCVVDELSTLTIDC